MHFSATAWQEDCTRRLPAERFWLMPAVRADNACASWCVIVTPLGVLGIVTAKVFEVKTDVRSAASQCVCKLVCYRYTIGRARYRYHVAKISTL